MGLITETSPITYPGLLGVTIYPRDGQVQAGQEQEVLVVCGPNVHIPLHTHEVDASMFVVAGRATVLSDRQEADGREVGPGTCVFFEKHVAHGFKAGPEGMTFLSRNGGIVDEDDAKWDISFAEPN